jgi:hypothetical protein
MLPLWSVVAFLTNVLTQHGVIAKLGKAVLDRSVNFVQVMLTVGNEVELRCHEFGVQFGELGRNHVFPFTSSSALVSDSGTPAPSAHSPAGHRSDLTIFVFSGAHHHKILAGPDATP